MARCEECLHYCVCAKEGRMVQIDEHTWDDYNQLDDVERFCENYITAANVAQRADVAREIFGDIYNTMSSVFVSVQRSCVGMHGDNPETMRLLGRVEGVTRLGDAIADLKKRYESEGAE